MKHGDLVRVFYPYGGEAWHGPFHGFVCMTPDDHADAVWQMWCFERNTYHILSPNKDRIEVVSEA
tara:strand:- start:302 stop:496 length:195 start_codon:yes stop_codon:yes gene_type:complete